VPCTTIRDATAIARQNVFWRLRTPVNLITATFILSMAASLLSLAHEDEAVDNLFANWDTDESDGIVVA
jgi:hypothetical protein